MGPDKAKGSNSGNTNRRAVCGADASDFNVCPFPPWQIVLDVGAVALACSGFSWLIASIGCFCNGNAVTDRRILAWADTHAGLTSPLRNDAVVAAQARMAKRLPRHDQPPAVQLVTR